MVDAYPALLAQLRPELAEHGGRRAHAAPLDELVQPVGGRCDAMAEEQQRANLAIQLAGFGEFNLQALDIGGQRRIREQDATHEPTHFYPCCKNAATPVLRQDAYDCPAAASAAPRSPDHTA
ncbi:hypothetical protein [Paraburkholderia aromaticivorans]|uniref:hypothetical protein n=1 Tax=Paraburkholderia aromaticivorans TaxID=2026199 RepID=UPI003D67B554